MVIRVNLLKPALSKTTAYYMLPARNIFATKLHILNYIFVSNQKTERLWKQCNTTVSTCIPAATASTTKTHTNIQFLYSLLFRFLF